MLWAFRELISSSIKSNNLFCGNYLKQRGQAQTQTHTLLYMHICICKCTPMDVYALSVLKYFVINIYELTAAQYTHVKEVYITRHQYMYIYLAALLEAFLFTWLQITSLSLQMANFVYDIRALKALRQALIFCNN